MNNKSLYLVLFTTSCLFCSSIAFNIGAILVCPADNFSEKIFENTDSTNQIHSLSKKLPLDQINFHSESTANNYDDKQVVDQFTVALWNFDVLSDKIAVDSTLNNNDGTIYGAEWASGLDSIALFFDSSESDYISIPHNNNLNLAPNFTIEMMFYLESLPSITGEMCLLAKGDPVDPNNHFGIYLMTDDHINLHFEYGSGLDVLLSSNTMIFSKTWYYLAITYDSKELVLNINGIADAKTTSSFAQGVNSENLHIGSSYDDPINKRYFHGLIDEVRISNTSREILNYLPHELETVYLEKPIVDPFTKAMWHFDDNIGTNALDSSIYENNGTIYGCDWTQGMFNSSVLFNYTESDYINVDTDPSKLQIPQSFCIEVWFYLNSLPSTINLNMTILSNGVLAYPDCSFGLDIIGNSGASDLDKINFYIQNNLGNDSILLSDVAVQEGKWHHLGASYNGSTQQIWLNGTLVGTKDIIILPGVNSGFINIGWNNFDGILDELRISSCSRKFVETITDTDNDGLSDDYENFVYFTNSTNTDTDDDNLTDGDEILGIYKPTNSGADSFGFIYTNATNNDTDSDLLNDYFEIYNLNTNPKLADTENDGIDDGYEYANTLDPFSDDSSFDPDSDDLSNLIEFTIGTYARNNDSDNDLMPDGWEYYNGLNPIVDDGSADVDYDDLENYFEYLVGSDPYDSDTDDDGMPDGWEYYNGLNPLVHDAFIDLDSDGLSNYEEYNSNTDPFNEDTDDDGMPDGWEFEHSLNPLVDDANNDPDNDGLLNIEEYEYGTHPFFADTDDDGFTDLEEIQEGTDPTDDSSHPFVFTLQLKLIIAGSIIGILILIFSTFFIIRYRSIQKKAKEMSKSLEISISDANELRTKLAQYDEVIVTKRQKDFRSLINRYSKVTLSKLTELLKFYNNKETEKWLLSLPDDLQFYLEGDLVIIPQKELLGDSYNAQFALKRIDQSFQNLKSYTCFYCGLPLEKSMKTCPDCHKEILSCTVCKLPIIFGDEIGQCSLCETKGHLNHLQEWVKIQGKCPHCLEYIPIEGIFPIETIEVKKKTSM